MKLAFTFATAIRVAALAFGAVMIIASMPLAVLVASFPAETRSPLSPLLLMPAWACALASGFLYVGVVGRRMASSKWHRLLAGVLLAVPLGWGVSLLVQTKQPPVIGLLVLLPATGVFLCTVWPWHFTSGQA